MLQELLARAEPAVVMVVCRDINTKGSGFLVSPDGYIVTNNHVVAEPTLQNDVVNFSYSRMITAVVDGTPHTATLVSDYRDFRPIVYDYAILKVVGLGNVPYLEVGDPGAVRRGDGVVCLGFPLDFDSLIATNGIVSAVISRASHVNSLHQMRTIVSNALIQFGNSGGPMLHAESGKVIGINTLSHELRDVLARRLSTWYDHPDVAAVPGLRDLIRYSLKYTYVGLNHAVSIEHVRDDAAWPARREEAL